jgi:hypothetical protein
MKKEKRRAPRVNVNLPANWTGAHNGEAATVTSLSQSGCFLLSGGEVSPKEIVQLKITLPSNECLSLVGEIVEAAPEIGFAVRFTDWTKDEARLRDFLELAQNSLRPT